MSAASNGSSETIGLRTAVEYGIGAWMAGYFVISVLTILLLGVGPLEAIFGSLWWHLLVHLLVVPGEFGGFADVLEVVGSQELMALSLIPMGLLAGAGYVAVPDRIDDVLTAGKAGAKLGVGYAMPCALLLLSMVAAGTGVMTAAIAFVIIGGVYPAIFGGIGAIVGAIR